MATCASLGAKPQAMADAPQDLDCHSFCGRPIRDPGHRWRSRRLAETSQFGYRPCFQLIALAAGKAITAGEAITGPK
jgi:hypothetical protein